MAPLLKKRQFEQAGSDFLLTSVCVTFAVVSVIRPLSYPEMGKILLKSILLQDTVSHKKKYLVPNLCVSFQELVTCKNELLSGGLFQGEGLLEGAF